MVIYKVDVVTKLGVSDVFDSVVYKMMNFVRQWIIWYWMCLFHRSVLNPSQRLVLTLVLSSHKAILYHWLVVLSVFLMLYKCLMLKYFYKLYIKYKLVGVCASHMYFYNSSRKFIYAWFNISAMKISMLIGMYIF